MARPQPVAQINYVKPKALVETCPTCSAPVEACQAGLWEKLYTPGHHMHFNRSGSCTLSPSCTSSFKTRSPDLCSGAGSFVLNALPQGLRALDFGLVSPERSSIDAHYRVPGLAMRNRRVAWWGRPSDVFLAKEWAQTPAGPTRRTASLPEAQISNSKGTCRDCGAEVIWGETAAGQRAPLEMATMQAAAEPGRMVGSVHWDHCEKAPQNRERQRRDRARQGEKD